MTTDPRPNHLNIKKEENVKNNTLALPKGTKMVYNVFEKGLFALAPHDN